MAWFLYYQRDGWVRGESVSQYQNTASIYAQVEDPTDNRTPGLGTWIYDGAQLRDATQQEIDDYPANRDLDDEQLKREAAKRELDEQRDKTGKMLRAFAVLMLDEFNRHTERINGILDAIDNANNLASVKSAVGAIADLPTRTKSDLIAALKNNIDNGE